MASLSEEKGRAFASKYHCDYCTYDELLARDDVNAVYVSVPVGLHHEWATKVLASGKHLLLEKTFTDNWEKACQIISMAQARSLVAMEALVYMYHPLYETVRAAIDAGEIGELAHLEAFFGFPFLPASDIRNNRSLGGGAALDALIYPLSFCLSLSPEPYLRYSSHVIYDKEYNIDARGFLQIDWHDHSAHVSYGFGFMYRNYYSAWGDKGYLTVDRAFTRPPDLKSEIVIHQQGHTKIIEVPPANHFDRMVSAFALKIRGDDKSGVNEDQDILRRLKIITEVYNAGLESAQ